MLTAATSMLVSILSFIVFISNIGAAGEKAWDNEAYEKFVSQRFSFLEKASFGLYPPNRFEVTWDPIFQEAWAVIEEDNGFDMNAMSNTMSDAFYYLRWQQKVNPLLNPIADWMLDRSLYYHEQDNFMMKTVFRLGGAFIKMPYKAHIAAEPVEGVKNEYEAVAYLGYQDGSTVRVATGTTYNVKTGLIGGESGFGNTSFRYNVKDKMVDTTIDSVFRYLGFSPYYDMAILRTTKMVDLDTIRIDYNYDGKVWRTQLWKGRYFNMPGGEVGYYSKPESRRIDWVKAEGDDEPEFLIPMSIKVIDNRDGKVLVDKPIESHWWQTGFAAVHQPINDRYLTLETILVPEPEHYKPMQGALDQMQKDGVLTYSKVKTAVGPGFNVVW